MGMGWRAAPVLECYRPGLASAKRADMHDVPALRREAPAPRAIRTAVVEQIATFRVGTTFEAGAVCVANELDERQGQQSLERTPVISLGNNAVRPTTALQLRAPKLRRLIKKTVETRYIARPESSAVIGPGAHPGTEGPEVIQVSARGGH